MPMMEMQATHKPRAQEMKGIVSALAAAKSVQNVDAAMNIYHPECVLETPPMGTRYEGERSIRRALERFVEFAPDYAVSLVGQAADGDTLCSWGTIQFTPQHGFHGEIPNGKCVSVPVFILFRFRDERVIWESFNFDVAAVARQTGLDAGAYVMS